VAEGARLESVFTRKGNVGSNPTLSASFKALTGDEITRKSVYGHPRYLRGGLSHFQSHATALAVAHGCPNIGMTHQELLHGGCSPRVIKLRLQRCFGRALAASVQPVFKVLDLHNMRNLGMPDLDGDGRESTSDVADPGFTRRVARAWAMASYRVSAVTSTECAVWFRSQTTTVQALSATHAI
jgi:hypothetical protein